MKRVPIPTASEIMQRHVQTVSPDDELEKAIRALLKRRHSGVPVVDSDGNVVGVLSERESVAVLAQAAAEKWPPGRVCDRMSTEFETVSPDEDLFALSTRFSNGRHRRLLVVDDGKLVGVISRSDLLGALEVLVARLAAEPRTGTYEAIAKRHHELD